MMKKHVLNLILILLCIFTLTGCSKVIDHIYGGYSEKEIVINKDDKYYIAGYKGGRYFTDILDYQKAKAFYMNYYGEETLLITIDCVGLTSEYVNQIRKKLNFNFKVNVISTHTHAGVDTMGLWGPAAVEGKDEIFMNKLIDAAVSAGKDAYNNRKEGKLTFGSIETNDILIDSRDPLVYDKNIYQLKFISNDNTESTRLVFFSAHAESLRGDNTKISADFPSEMANIIKQKTNDNMMYFPGAIGGLVMTDTFDEDDFENNRKITAQKLVEYVLNIKEEEITSKDFEQVTVKFKTKLENTLFKYYKFLGILKNKITKNPFTNSYYLMTELSIIKIGDIAITLIPGEIFPELVYGGAITNSLVDNTNPETLVDLAKEYNINKLIIVGLANDEIGYIIPPSDFLVNSKYPYVQNITDDKGENHYEETMSVGEFCANDIANAFEKCLKKLK